LIEAALHLGWSTVTLVPEICEKMSPMKLLSFVAGNFTSTFAITANCCDGNETDSELPSNKAE